MDGLWPLVLGLQVHVFHCTLLATLTTCTTHRLLYRTFYVSSVKGDMCNLHVVNAGHAANCRYSIAAIAAAGGDDDDNTIGLILPCLLKKPYLHPRLF